jgi:hypothetical protein
MMAGMARADEERRTEELLDALARRAAAEPCVACAAPVCGHAYVANVALGYKNAPRCVPCLAKGFDRDAAGFLADVRGHVARRACLQAGWEWASANGGTLDG